ncbi:MAG TPA: BatD family protein [Flavobacteriales bacterium]|jgi:hypothetical protein|nr:BatD family protein [Flavobacteriales bacterium]
MRALLLSVALLAAPLLSAQDGLLTVEVPLDTVGVGQLFRVMWTVHAKPDTLVAPTFGPPWQFDNGPFQSTSMKSQNGVVTNSVSWACALHASTAGPALLPVMRARVQGRWYTSPAVEVVVTVDARPDSTLHAKAPARYRGPAVPVTDYQPMLIQISGTAGQIAVQDAGAKLQVHTLTPGEVQQLIERLQELVPPADPGVVLDLMMQADTAFIQVSGPYDAGRNEGLTRERTRRMAAVMHRYLPEAGPDALFFATVQEDGACYIVAHDNGNELVRYPEPEEARELEDALRNMLAEVPPSGISATLGKTGGSIALSPSEGDDRFVRLSAAQAKKLEGEVRKLLKKKRRN